MSQTLVIDIPISSIDLGSNVREEITDDSVKELATAFQRHGQQEAVTVCPAGKRFRLIRGFRRVASAKLAGEQFVRANVEERPLTEAEVLVSQLSENLHRKNLTEWELAKAIERLITETGWSAGQVSAELVLNSSHVCNLRSLLKLPPAVQEAVREKRLPVSTAFEIARAGDAETQVRLAEEAERGGLSRDAVAAKVKSSKRRSTKSTQGVNGRVTALLGQGRSVSVSASELTLDGFIGLLEELLGKARRARPKGLELATFIKMLRDQSRNGEKEGASC